jgi:hypothetical protein
VIRVVCQYADAITTIDDDFRLAEVDDGRIACADVQEVYGESARCRRKRQCPTPTCGTTAEGRRPWQDGSTEQRNHER